MRRAAVNVDVDGLYLYDRIHGHQGGSGNAAGFDPATADATVWTKGVVRFLDLFDRTGIKGSFFVVAQDIANPDVQAVLKEVVAAGHEVGNHSLTHPYDLSRQSRAAIDEELAEARSRIEEFCGVQVSGFRAPGYVLSEDLLESVVATGHVYDSSRFPCPPYQAAKAAVIGAYALLGRPSGSIPEPPTVWLSGTEPEVQRLPSGRAALEFPIGVIPPLRMPLIGTSVIALGRAGQIALQPFVDRAPWINFECHAIDLTDHRADGIPAHLAVQPDQKVPLSKKWPLFVRLIERMKRTHTIATLADWTLQEFDRPRDDEPGD